MQTQNAGINAPHNPPIASHLARKIRPDKTIEELAKELTRIEKTKRDFTVPINMISAKIVEKFPLSTEPLPPSKHVALSFRNGEDHNFTLNNFSGGQVAQFTDIPTQYFRRLNQEAPELLATNINHGLARIQKNEETKSRLLRTVDGHVRGFLSHRYRMLDSYDLMQVMLPVLMESDFQVFSSELTEKRLYLKCATPRIQGDVKVGDTVSYGLMLSTSDVGAGKLLIEKFFARLWCLNGAVSDVILGKTHLGGSNHEREVRELLTDDTKKLNDKALFATIKDCISHSMRQDVFEKDLDKMKDAANRQIKNFDLEQVVETTMRTVGVTGEGIKKGILEALADGNQNAGLTQWGLMNSFTAAAKLPSIDYDTATELERAGGQILNLNPAQWRRISEVQQ